MTTRSLEGNTKNIDKIRSR